MPADGWEERVRASFARQGAMAHLGVTIVDLQPGRCTLTTSYAPHLGQQNGFFHAGVTSAIADSAGGYAGLTLFAPGDDVLTVEFKINLIAPAHGERLRATGVVERCGRTLSVCRIDVAVERDGVSTPCALVQQTLFRVPARPAS